MCFVLQKLKRRKAATKWLNKEDNEKLAPVLTLDFMSSEDDDEDGLRQVKHLPWQSEELERYKFHLDKLFIEKATAHHTSHLSKKVRKSKTLITTREVPEATPRWALHD